MTAAARWAAALAAWKIPDAILAQAPERPWGFPPALFGASGAPLGALHRLAGEALARGGSVLDVGCGGGAASVPLVPPAETLTGLDSLPKMLASFAAAAEAAGVAHSEVLGDWPAVAAEAPVSDVVVCRNVVYNVPEIVPFLERLTAHAARRVVVELTELHPSVTLAPLWQRFWGLPRPVGPSASDFADVLAELGYRPQVECELRPALKAASGDADHVAFVRRRLCLEQSRDPEIAAALTEASRAGSTAAAPGAVTAVVMAWDGEGSR